MELSNELLVLKFNVCDLYDRYNSALDKEDYETWLSLFEDDASYRVTTRENWAQGLPLSTIKCESRDMLADRVSALGRTMMFAPRSYRRFNSSVVIDAVEGDELKVSSSLFVAQTEVDKATQAAFSGQLLDRLVIRAGALKIAERVCVLDTEMLPNSLIYPL